jgi:anti-sigma factor RsiW
MKVRWWRTDVVCQQWMELVTAYLEGALPRRTRKAIDRHLPRGRHCREYLEQMRLTIRMTGELQLDDDVPDDVVDALVAAFLDLHPPTTDRLSSAQRFVGETTQTVRGCTCALKPMASLARDGSATMWRTSPSR